MKTTLTSSSNCSCRTMRLLVKIAAAVFIGFSVGTVLAAPEPFHDGLGKHRMTVTTDSPKAQRYFGQGMAFLHGFNHGAAIRSFTEATKLDPECAMAHWAIALASGPHINFPLVPQPAAELAWKELELAKKHAERAAELEKKL